MGATSVRAPGGSGSGTPRKLSTRPPEGVVAAALPRSWRWRSAAWVRNALVGLSFEVAMAGAGADAATLMPMPRASGIGE